LEGDCNQIVTFYAYLYSLKYPISDLQIKLLPEHVCLHFRGVDVEATNGEFYKYDKDDQILPITEIISTNLLDLSDFREETQQIDERDMLKSAQLAYAISSLKDLVGKNLQIAYRNLAIAALNSKHFDSAIFYAEKITGEGDLSGRDLLKSVYRNACIYYLESKSFKKARFYADKSTDLSLIREVKLREGVDYYERKVYDEALRIFTELGDEKMKNACYGAQYNDIAHRVTNVKTIADAKRYKNEYRKMLELALKMREEKLAEGVRRTLEQL